MDGQRFNRTPRQIRSAGMPPVAPQPQQVQPQPPQQQQAPPGYYFDQQNRLVPQGYFADANGQLYPIQQQQPQMYAPQPAYQQQPLNPPPMEYDLDEPVVDTKKKKKSRFGGGNGPPMGYMIPPLLVTVLTAAGVMACAYFTFIMDTPNSTKTIQYLPALVGLLFIMGCIGFFGIWTRLPKNGYT